MKGGFFSHKYGVFISAGKYNQVLGAIFMLIAIFVFYVSLRRKN